MVLCLPLIPYKLPESSAQLLGSALGAFIAVTGAAWLARGSDRKRARTLATRTALAIEVVASQCLLFEDWVQKIAETPALAESMEGPLRHTAQRIRDAADKAKAELAVLHPSYVEVGAGAVLVFPRINAVLDDVLLHVLPFSGTSMPSFPFLSQISGLLMKDRRRLIEQLEEILLKA